MVKDVGYKFMTFPVFRSKTPCGKCLNLSNRAKALPCLILLLRSSPFFCPLITALPAPLLGPRRPLPHRCHSVRALAGALGALERGRGRAGRGDRTGGLGEVQFASSLSGRAAR